jgi:hypothetical protein
MENNIEIWKKIEEYDNYEVSNMGNVRNIKTYRLLKKSIINNYCIVGLSKKNIEKKIFVHNLVAGAFLEKNNEVNNLIVHHINLITYDNNLNNLIYISQSDNMKHNYKINSKNRNLKNFDLSLFIDIPLNKNYMISKGGDIYSKYLKKFLSFRKDRDYHSVKLYNNGKYKSYFIHRLVANAFLNFDINSKLCINHIDGNKKNNKLENLEILSISQNVLHSYNNLNRKIYKRPIYCIDTENNKIFFNSITEASIKYKIDGSGITKCCKGIYNNIKGLKFYYQNEPLNTKSI